MEWKAVGVATDTKTVAEDRIGQYRFVRTIHASQTSIVMEVVQDTTGKRFVIKQLLPRDHLDSSAVKALEFEAKLGMDLRHPNLVKVFEFVRDRHAPYFVMEFFSSNHLRLALGKPREYGVPRDRLHRILEQAASALAYLHDKGWIHRDIKPENILINKTYEVRVIDYSLAMRPYTGFKKLFNRKAPCQGTHTYMSPEQILSQPPTVKADLYSFGIVCYELACGRPPFRADSPTELLRKHLREQPTPPTSHNKQITPEFSDLVMQMIRKNPKDRPENLHEFISRFSRIKIFHDVEDESARR